MTLTEVTELLRPCFSKEETATHAASAFAVQFEGRQWAVGTNRHFLAAVPFDGELRSDGPKALTVFPTRKLTHISTRAELIEAAGEPEIAECENCTGGRCDGCHCDNEHECGDCKGTGRVSVHRRIAMLAGAVDPDLLAVLLATAPEGKIVVGQAGPEEPYQFRATDWIGVVMPIRLSDGERAALPRLDLKVMTAPFIHGKQLSRKVAR